MRRHLEGAHLEQAEAPGRTVGRVELVDAELGAVRIAGHVDQQVAHQPVDQPRRTRAVLRGDAAQFGERDLDLVDRIVARFIDARRLARRPDEETREQVRERRMVVPVGDHAREQIGPAQERRIGDRRAAEHEVVAAAGAGVATVEHELLGRQPRLVGRLVEVRGLIDQFAPTVGRMDVDLDHARIGRDAQGREAWILRRLIAFEDQRQLHLERGVLDGGKPVRGSPPAPSSAA